jgi:FkbM family methyltransferase
MINTVLSFLKSSNPQYAVCSQLQLSPPTEYAPSAIGGAACHFQRRDLRLSRNDDSDAMAEPDVKWVKFDVSKRIGAFLFEKLNATRNAEVSFVQVGANDGSSEDPVSVLAKRHKWTGLVIEPVKALFTELCTTYRNSPRIECVKAACAEKARELQFFQIKYRNGQSAHSNKGLSSLHRDVIRGHFKSEEEFDRNVEEIRVAALPLNELLEARKIERVNLLVTDTEGADLQVLQGFDLQKYAPDLLMIEHYHLGEEGRRTLNEMMHGAGYDRVIGAMDSFFFRPSLLRNIEADTLAAFRHPVLAWTWEDNHFTEAARP